MDVDVSYSNDLNFLDLGIDSTILGRDFKYNVNSYRQYRGISMDPLTKSVKLHYRKSWDNGFMRARSSSVWVAIHLDLHLHGTTVS